MAPAIVLDLIIILFFSDIFDKLCKINENHVYDIH